MRAQLTLFLVAGAVQYSVDVALFSLAYLLGVPIWLTNIVARGTAATVGYLFNSRITFRHQQRRDSQEYPQIARFVATWFLLTLASTLLLFAVRQAAISLRLGDTAVIIGKAFVEAFLAAASFAVHKWWIFRSDAHSRQGTVRRTGANR